jgi:toxin ParE1/3/4
MPKYYLTNKAVDDLTKIWNYTYEEWSEQQADRYYQSLISHCEEISKNQKIAKNYTGITSSLFGLRATKHIIFYRVLSSSEVEITRILHERMDLKRRIME